MLHAGLLYKIFQISDKALTVDFGNIIDESLNKKVIALFGFLRAHSIPGIEEVLPAYSSLSVFYNPHVFKKMNPAIPAFEQVKDIISEIISGNFEMAGQQTRLVTIPVCYEKEWGPDQENIAAIKGITTGELIQIHYDTIYKVYMNGFLPGFAYMGEVDERIAISRHASPRQRIEAGSVGIAGRQTGIYPFDSPGGWQIIGKTPYELFNKEIVSEEQAERLTLLKPGDKVQFYPISKDEFEKIKLEKQHFSAAAPVVTHKKGVQVKKPGLLSSIQDTGRKGFRYLGINPGGAMDKQALQKANALVGNPLHEAGIEIFFPGPEIIFETDLLIAITGADFSPIINNEPIVNDQAVCIKAGTELSFTRPVSGHCCYLAVAGGFDIPSWLGSYSTNLKAAAGGWEGRTLKKEDQIPLKKQVACNENVIPSIQFPGTKQNHSIRILPGKEWHRLTEAAQEVLLNEGFVVSTVADRMGYRLNGTPLSFEEHNELVSSAVDFGTIQLLPDGQLIVLMADHQTTGGYPRVGHVISADHSSLAQKRPGEKIYFQLIDIKKAEELSEEQNERISRFQAGCLLQLKELLSY